MKSVNKVLLMGNVTHDAEVKATSSGQMVCTFGLATNRVWRDKSGAKQELPEFHNIVCWGRLAEACGKYIKKGKPMYVEGYLKTRNWENAETKAKVYRTEIVIDTINFLGTKDNADEDKAVEAPAEEEA